MYLLRLCLALLRFPLCVLHNVVNYGRQIVGAVLVKAIAPKLWHDIGQLEVMPAIGRGATQIRQPHIVVALMQLKGCSKHTQCYK